MCGLFLGCTLAGSALAVSLDVAANSVITVFPGQYFDSAIVRSNGVLILNGGGIGTNTYPSPSVTIQAGGRFCVNDGSIQYFENSGIVELYGGRQSTVSSLNLGHVILAGGDPGIQLLHWGGTLDIRYLATNRTSWEVDATSAVATPAIRIFSLTNTLPDNIYYYGTLPGVPIPPGVVHTNHALLWNPVTNSAVRTDIIIPTNWPGSVSVITYSPLPANSITCFIQRASAVTVGWSSLTGRIYQVEDAFDLGIQDWLALSTPVPGTGVTTTILSAALTTNRLYRVRLRY